MFLYRLASGLVFLSGGVLSKVGIALENWPTMAAGLIAATLGLWHFFMVGTASQPGRRKRRRDEARKARDALPAELGLRHA